MALAAQILSSQDGHWVYGGFVRDAIVRNDMHSEMDLDVGISKSGSSSVAGAMASITQLAKDVGLNFVRNGVAYNLVSVAFFATADNSSAFEVQVSPWFSIV